MYYLHYQCAISLELVQKDLNLTSILLAITMVAVYNTVHYRAFYWHTVRCSSILQYNIIQYTGNSIVYRNHKVCNRKASSCDGVPSYIVTMKLWQSIISHMMESFHMMESHHMMEFHNMMTVHHIMNKRCACSSSGLPASEGPDRRV